MAAPLTVRTYLPQLKNQSLKNTITALLFAASANLCHSQVYTTTGGTATSGVTGTLCLGSYLADPSHITTSSPTDYAEVNILAGVNCDYWVRGTLSSPAPVGYYAGFKIASSNLVGVLSGVELQTYNGGALQETRSGGSLLNVLSGGEGYVYFKTTQPHDAVQIKFEGTSLLMNARVYHGFSQAANSFSILPLRFGALQATRQPGYAALQWKLETDELLRTVDVQKSYDGRIFSTVATVPVEPSGRYRYNDYGTPAKAYYRIKATTAALQTHTSGVAAAEPVNETGILIWSPVRGNVTIHTGTLHATPLNVRIYNANGKMVSSAPKTTGSTHSVSLPSATGIYLVTVYNGNNLVHQAKIFNAD